MTIRLLLSSVALIATASAAGQHSNARDSAKKFTLDGLAPAPDASATPTMPSPSVPATSTVSGGNDPAAMPPVSDSPAPSSSGAEAPPALRVAFTLDTPIQNLIANPGAKKVLDKDLPGMSTDENLAKFQQLSLRQLQPQTGGQLTDALLMKVASDLDVLAGGDGKVAMPAPVVKPGNSKRDRDTSR